MSFSVAEKATSQKAGWWPFEIQGRLRSAKKAEEGAVSSSIDVAAAGEGGNRFVLRTGNIEARIAF